MDLSKLKLYHFLGLFSRWHRIQRLIRVCFFFFFFFFFFYLFFLFLFCCFVLFWHWIAYKLKTLPHKPNRIVLAYPWLIQQTTICYFLFFPERVWSGSTLFCAHITHWPVATLRGVQPIPVREVVTDSVRYIAMSGRELLKPGELK